MKNLVIDKADKATCFKSEAEIEYNELSSKSTKELKKELSHLLGLTAANLMRLALVVKVLDERGENMAAIQGGFLLILRRIANGELLPEVVVLFAGEPEKILRASKMTLEEQADVIDGKLEMPTRKQSAIPFSQPPQPASTYLPPLDRPAENRRPTRLPHYKEAESNQININTIAEVGIPKDIGEMASNLIEKCADPETAATVMLNRLASLGVVAKVPAGFVQKVKKKSRSWMD